MRKILQNLFFVLLALPAIVAGNLTIAEVQTLTPTIPGGPVFGDDYGQTVYNHGDFIFVAALLARPDPSKDAEGAVYVYKNKRGVWENTQIIVTEGMSDHLGALQIKVRGDWLFISAIGTPIGPIVNDVVTNQDFTGSLRIYHLNRCSGQWQFHQSIDRNTPGLSDLSPVDPAALANPPAPVQDVEQGGNFGITFDLTSDGKILLVGAAHQANTSPTGLSLINSGRVYAFALINDDWTLVQEITNPDGVAANDDFGSFIKIYKNFAFISNASLLIGPPLGNKSVYVFKLSHFGQWEFFQKLTGDQTFTTPVNIPAFGGVLNLGDAFGTSIDCDDGWVLIGAPSETGVSTVVGHGAAYFYHFEKVGNTKQFVRKQKVTSDDPAAVFTAISVSLDEGVALIGDQSHVGPTGSPAQGAILVYELSHKNWVKKLDLFDPAGVPFEFLGGGVTIDKNLIVTGTGNGFIALLTGFFIVPPVIPQPFPVVENKAIIWKIKSKAHKNIFNH